MTTDKTKEYLDRYFYAKRKLRELYEQNDEYIEVIVSAKAIEYSDMPRGSNKNSDLSDIMVRMENCLNRIIKQKALCRELKADNIRVIQTLKNRKQRKVMYLRYVQLYSWKRIEHEVSSCYTIHGRALQNIVIKDAENN